MSHAPKLLIIDHVQAGANAIGRALRREFDIYKANNGAVAFYILEKNTFPMKSE